MPLNADEGNVSVTVTVEPSVGRPPTLVTPRVKAILVSPGLGLTWLLKIFRSGAWTVVSTGSDSAVRAVFRVSDWNCATASLEITVPEGSPEPTTVSKVTVAELTPVAGRRPPRVADAP